VARYTTAPHRVAKISPGIQLAAPNTITNITHQITRAAHIPTHTACNDTADTPNETTHQTVTQNEVIEPERFVWTEPEQGEGMEETEEREREMEQDFETDETAQ